MERPLLYPLGEAGLRPRPAPVARAASDKPPCWRAPEPPADAAPRPADEALLPAGEQALLAAALYAPDEPWPGAPCPGGAPWPDGAPTPEEESQEAVPTSQMPTPVCVPLDEDPFAPRRRVWPWALGAAALCALLGLGWWLLRAAG